MKGRLWGDPGGGTAQVWGCESGWVVGRGGAVQLGDMAYSVCVCGFPEKIDEFMDYSMVSVISGSSSHISPLLRGLLVSGDPSSVSSSWGGSLAAQGPAPEGSRKTAKPLSCGSMSSCLPRRVALAHATRKQQIVRAG